MIASLAVAIAAVLVSAMAALDQVGDAGATAVARGAEPPTTVEPADDDLAEIDPDTELRALSARPAHGESTSPDASGSQEGRFAAAFGDHHAQARQGDDPASQHWAVIIGVDHYQGGVSSTLGSVADAHALRDALADRGWRDENVLVLTDGQATRDRVVLALQWLAQRTDERSTAVVSYSGHAQHDGNHTALWPTDSGFVWSDELGRLLADVDAGRAWFTFQGCHAEGLGGAGVEGDGRVVTYSSKLREKSYEDPETGYSVMGGYLLAEGLRDGMGSPEGQPVTVQAAFARAADRAHTRTSGRQTPQMVDRLGEPFTLTIDDSAPADEPSDDDSGRLPLLQ